MKTRQDEQRSAANFDRKAFQEISTLPEKIKNARTYTIVEKFMKSGVLKMYKSAKKTAALKSKKKVTKGPARKRPVLLAIEKKPRAY